MMRHALNLVGGIIVAVALSIAPVAAKQPPAGVWIDLHYSGPSGKTKTVVSQVQIPRADQAGATCANQKSIAAQGEFTLKYSPDLTGMTFVGGNCELDKQGQPKVAIGSWPGGFRPSVTMPVKPVDPYAGMAKDTAEPAVVLMTFRFITGAVKTYEAGPSQGYQALDMKTCPERLNGLLRVLTRSVTFYSGGTLLSAKCAPMNVSKK